VVDPILRHWSRESRAPVPDYPGGSMGPPEADALIERDGWQWRN
jgi:glucose-6-phosphate 1-dehydrogenase